MSVPTVLWSRPKTFSKIQRRSKTPQPSIRHLLLLAFEWVALHTTGNLGYSVSASMPIERDRHAALGILNAKKGMAGRLFSD
jgi:hypothetical protein